jgi:PAS domain S-box-containing protein
MPAPPDPRRAASLPPPDDPIDLSFLRLAVVLMLAGGFGFVAVVLLLAPDQKVRALGGVLFGLVALVAAAFLQRGQTVATIRTLAYGMWAVVSFMTLVGGGLRAPIVIAYPALVALGGWLLGGATAILMTALTVLFGLGLLVAEGLGLLPAIGAAPAGIAWTVFALVLVATATLTIYASRSYRTMYERQGRLASDMATKAGALATEETRLRHITENVPAMIFHGNRDLRCLYANRQFADFFHGGGVPVEGMHLRDILGDAAFRDALPNIEQALAGKAILLEGERQAIGGDTRFLEISLVPEKDASGNVVGFYALKVDVTERRQAEAAQRHSEERFSLIFRSSPEAVSISAEQDGRYLDINDAFTRLFGWTQKEAVGKSALELGLWADPDDRARWIEALRTNGSARDFEALFRRKDGEFRSVLISAGILELDGERWILSFCYDNTERKRTQEALRRSEDKFSSVFQASPIAISLARLSDGTFLDINPAFVRTFGWGRRELVGRNSTEVGIWPSMAERERWVKELTASGRTRDFVVNWRNKAGEARICQISADVVQIGGEPYILALTSDVTDRVRAEEALKTSQARLTEAQRIGRFGSWELDLIKDSFIWSGEIGNIFETAAPPGSVGYATFLKTLHPEDRESFDKAYRQTIAEGKSGEFAYRLRMRDGRVKYVHVRCETQLDPDGKPAKSVGTTQDVTEQVLARQEIERLNAELERRVQERTAELTAANRELESFAYSISHDLRAPLRGIDGFSQLLADEYRSRLDAQGIDYLERVRRAAQRMGTLIDDILELSRVTRQEMRRVRVDLSQMAAELLEERTRTEPEHRVEVLIAPGCKAFGDPQLLRVMLQNLLENAWKYSSKQPDPRIEFGQETSDGETAFFVRDNGVGFDMQYADRLFTPFQRLHRPEEFEGTGIGLATVARIVRRHGGRIWTSAAPNQGATFRFTLGRR